MRKPEDIDAALRPKSLTGAGQDHAGADCREGNGGRFPFNLRPRHRQVGRSGGAADQS